MNMARRQKNDFACKPTPTYAERRRTSQNKSRGGNAL